MNTFLMTFPASVRKNMQPVVDHNKPCTHSVTGYHPKLTPNQSVLPMLLHGNMYMTFMIIFVLFIVKSKSWVDKISVFNQMHS